MSTRKGAVHRKPAHQNTFAFRHNPKSKKTAKILAMPNQGLCKSCHDKVEWRKKYRKYKPLRQPASCNDCHQKTVTAAYHTICRPCAQARKVCPWCCGSMRPPPAGEKGGEGASAGDGSAGEAMDEEDGTEVAVGGEGGGVVAEQAGAAAEDGDDAEADAGLRGAPPQGKSDEGAAGVGEGSVS